jgi:hypothetical protein
MLPPSSSRSETGYNLNFLYKHSSLLPENRVVSRWKKTLEAQLILSEHPLARTSLPKDPNLTHFCFSIWNNMFLQNLSNIYQITRCHKPGDHIVNSHGRKNKRSHTIVLLKFLGPKQLFQDISICCTTVCESLTAYASFLGASAILQVVY